MTASRLEQSLGYTFHDRALLLTALTHRSYSSPHNERLEFLGDAILNAVIARCLFERYPMLPEGDLSRLRANLVRQDSLHQQALALALGDCLRLGEGEQKSGGQQRPSILADALEALFGALWLDAGFDAAAAVVMRVYESVLDQLTPDQGIKDAKTRLQEHLQGMRLALPKYTLAATEGEAHAQQFKVVCVIEAFKIHTEGRGANRRAAEQMAAERALVALEKR
ncbi:MAG: ribonuclease III [Candidatus Accumulibacter propinquus]|jgi:ribonuclease-3|uniref:ribonuclease III n=1 Tax=Candidatus Accumulibacter TaxID=327159 RepID=UPI001AD26CC4|nr:ribonuclease III [Accumulibacter sp.]MBK8386939.1 ribonuclease III [Accumulibacter sp.]MBK8578421.1 ribonuclease III [Candidatus Accumulibacter propinquus]MBN8437253.1 ribonuclease III [Accumulibacter sp.]